MQMNIWIQLAFCAAVIVVAGAQLSRLAEDISEKCGLSKALAGLVLLAVTTSLSQLVACISAAVFHDLPTMAISAPIGSSMFSMMIIGILDFFSKGRPASLEVNEGHILSAGFGIILLALATVDIVFGRHLPAIRLLHSMDPITILFIPIYVLAMILTFRFEKTKADQKSGPSVGTHEDRRPLPVLILLFLLCGAAIVAASYYLPELAEKLARTMGWADGFVGSSLVAITTCLPEVTVAISAAKMGSFDMAVASLLGSNLCYIAILAITDFFYLKEPLLRHASISTALGALSAIVSMAIVILALTYRPQKKFAFIAGDAIALILVYVFANMLLFSLH